MIAVLGGLADVERDLIRTRTAEGRSRAQKRAAHGPTTEIDRGAAGRGPQATGRGRDACRTRAQLPRWQEHDFKVEGVKTDTTAHNEEASAAMGLMRPHTNELARN
jgi:hypothetical protein